MKRILIGMNMDIVWNEQSSKDFEIELYKRGDKVAAMAISAINEKCKEKNIDISTLSKMTNLPYKMVYSCCKGEENNFYVFFIICNVLEIDFEAIYDTVFDTEFSVKQKEWSKYKESLDKNYFKSIEDDVKEIAQKERETLFEALYLERLIREKSEVTKRIGQAITHKRKENDIDLKELSELSRVSITNINKIENGNEIPLSQVIAILFVLNLELSVIEKENKTDHEPDRKND